MNILRAALPHACLLAITIPYIAMARPPLDEVDEKPFAEARILLQLSDGDYEEQAMVIDNANNLLRHYGGLDNVDIEVVTFGPGYQLLTKDSPLAPRVKSLMISGVRFAVCEITLTTIKAETGSSPKLIDDVYRVPSGIAHIVTRSHDGFVVVKP